MMLRLMICAGKTDPGPTHCRSLRNQDTFGKWCRSYRKMPGPKTATQTLRKPARLKCMQDISQEPLCAKLYKKNARAQNRDADFEPAQAKFTGHFTAWQNLKEKCRSPKPRRSPAQSTFHSSHLAPEFTRKMPEPNTAMQTF